jgi:hypothetical protein
VEAHQIGFVGSLPLSDHPDLLAIPTSRYRVVGEQWTVLLYHDGGKGRPVCGACSPTSAPTRQRLADLLNVHQYAPTR